MRESQQSTLSTGWGTTTSPTSHGRSCTSSGEPPRSFGTDEPFASYFNTIPKYVISSALTEPEWNNTTAVPGDPTAVQRVKDGLDGDIGMSGSATTVRWLLNHDLLDELKLLVHPIAVGQGRRLFEDATTYKLRLLQSNTLSTGVLDLTYAPDDSS